MSNLISKIFITGIIKIKTGLHIGGSKTALDIGGIDLSVIKTPLGIPYIPGSSMKGKLRSLLAKEKGSQDIKNDLPVIKEIFGDAGKNNEKGQISRLIVRDSFMVNSEKLKSKKDDFENLEFDYTESKWENTIDRKTGTAEHPRQLERVPAGAEFSFEFVYNNFNNDVAKEHIEEIVKAMKLLEDDYLGGSGSRGYGKIKFQDVQIREKTIKIYEEKGESINYEKVKF